MMYQVYFMAKNPSPGEDMEPVGREIFLCEEDAKAYMVEEQVCGISWHPKTDRKDGLRWNGEDEFFEYEIRKVHVWTPTTKVDA